MPDTRLTMIASFIRSTTFRITTYCTMAFVGVLLGLFAAFQFGAAALWRSELRETVQEEQQRLMKAYQAEGLAGLKELVEMRARKIKDQGFIYLLQDKSGARQAGNLDAMAPKVGWYDFVPPWLDEDEPFVTAGLMLPDGGFLLIGHDAYEMLEAVDLAEEGSVWILVIVLPLSLLTGLAISALILRRLEAINRLTLEIRSGNIKKRLPLSASGDEFDRLAGHLNAMLDSVEDLTDGLRQVSNEIAHEMRTPLTRIHSKLETARREPMNAERLNETIESISGELNGLLGAFAAMLRIAQLDAGTSRSTFRQFELSEALSNLGQDFGPIAEGNGITLRVEIEPDLRVSGDRRLIVQMMVNLVENAISHSGASQIHLSASKREGEIMVGLADNGIGIPETERVRVFQRFYRLETGPKSTGYGLGLSFVAAIARLHRVAIALVDNQPGLRVELSFPSAEAQPALEATSSGLGAPAFPEAASSRPA